MKIKVELFNKVTGGMAIGYCEISEDTVNLAKLRASIPSGYEYCTYWVVEPPKPKAEWLRY